MTPQEQVWAKRRRAKYRLRENEKARSTASYAIRTQDEVATILGLTRQRVQQIERMALWKIRTALKRDWEMMLGRR